MAADAEATLPSLIEAVKRLVTPERKSAFQARAAKLFGDEEYSNRKSLVEEWLKKLPAAGNAQQGRAVFEKNCALCHAVGGQG